VTTSDQVRELRETLTAITDSLVRDYQCRVPTGRIISTLVLTRGELRCGGLYGTALLRAADLATRAKLDAQSSDDAYVKHDDDVKDDDYVKEE
jgi:hypothetical protein